MNTWAKLFERHRKTVILFGLLLVALAAAYSNGLNGGFMLDDHAFFDEHMRNPKFALHQLIPDKDKYFGIEGGKTHSYYRPVAHLLPMMCFLMFRNFTFGYHVFNVLLLWVAVVCIFLLIKRLFKRDDLAFLAALFYCIHPINTVMVEYITASVFSAQVIFMVLSLMCFLSALGREVDGGVERPGPVGNSSSKKGGALTAAGGAVRAGAFYALSVMFFMLAVFCHETSMALPFYAVAMVAMISRSWKQGLVKSWFYFAVVALYFLWRLKFASLNRSILSHYAMFDMNFFEYLASISRLLGWYMAKLIALQGVILIKAIPVVRQYVFAWILLGAAMIGIHVALYRRFRSVPEARLALVWFAIGFAPFLFAALFQPAHGPMLEPHWFPFSVIGFFLFLAIVFLRLLERPPRVLGKAALAVVIVTWVLMARVTNGYWSDEIRYCQYWLKQSPGFSAVEFYMAKAYELRKQYPLAKAHYAQALKSNYKPNLILTNLGLIALMESEWDSARRYFEESLKYDPNQAVTLSNLGVIAYQKEDYPTAKKYFQRAIEMNRFLILPRLNMARIYLKEDRPIDAERTYREILAITPHHETTLISLLKFYVERKDRDRALEVAREIADYSQSAQSQTNIGLFYVSLNLYKQAEESFRKAVVIRPPYAEAYWQMGGLYVRFGHVSEAEAVWRRGMALFPNDKRFSAGLLKLQLTNTGETPSP